MARPRVRRVVAAVGAVGALIATASAAGGQEPPDGAQAQSGFGSFSVSARADLSLVQIFDDGIPVIPPGQAAVELSLATAQATVDSLGSSRAFASAPYPGESIAGLPGLIGGTGPEGLPPLPPYPVLVTSAYPTQESDEVDQEVYILQASSSQSTSRGRAQFGGGTGEAFGLATGESVADVEATSGVVVATARTAVTGVELPGVLKVGSFDSTATITIEAGEDPVAETSFEAPVITVNGVGLRLGPEGLSVAESVIPVDPAPISALLAEAGVGIEYVPAQTGTTEGGSTYARSAAVLVTAEVEGPDGNMDRVVYELGRAYATADARPVPSVDVPPPAGPDGGVPTSAPTSGAAGTSSDGRRNGVAVAPPPQPVDGPLGGSPSPAVATAPIDPGGSLAGLYPMLALASLLALGASRLFGLLGVRLSTISSTSA